MKYLFLSLLILPYLALANVDLIDAVKKSDTAKVEELLKNNVDPKAQDKLGRAPLHYAVDKEIAELLLKKGADLNQKDNKGKTPLHLALSKGNKKFGKFLMTKGAQLDAKDNKGRTPFTQTEYKRKSWWNIAGFGKTVISKCQRVFRKKSKKSN